jgi:hypothetical protein
MPGLAPGILLLETILFGHHRSPHFLRRPGIAKYPKTAGSSEPGRYRCDEAWQLSAVQFMSQFDGEMNANRAR